MVGVLGNISLSVGSFVIMFQFCCSILLMFGSVGLYSITNGKIGCLVLLFLVWKSS